MKFSLRSLFIVTAIVAIYYTCIRYAWKPYYTISVEERVSDLDRRTRVVGIFYQRFDPDKCYLLNLGFPTYKWSGYHLLKAFYAEPHGVADAEAWVLSEECKVKVKKVHEQWGKH